MSQVQVQPVEQNTATFENLFCRVQDMITKVEERAYQLFEDRGREHGYELDDWFKAENEILKPYKYELAKTDKDLTISMDVPGFEAKDLRVELIPGAVVVEGEAYKKEAGKAAGGSYQSETSQNVFRRIPLPKGVQSELTKAELKDQKLRVIMPLSAKKDVQVEDAAAGQTKTAAA